MIIGHEELAGIRKRHPGQVLVYASGCFDIIHPGHLRLVQHVKSLGDVAIIGVTPDTRVRRRKGPGRPINPQDTRAAIVDALRCVDYTLITPEAVPDVRVVGHHVLQQLRPDIYVTDDPAWRADEGMLNGQDTQLLPGPTPLAGVSTTTIINRILAHRSV